MKNCIKVIILVIVVLSFVLTPSRETISATELPNYQKLYSQAVEEGAIDEKEISYENFLAENKKTYLPTYEEGITKHVLDFSMDYGTWLKFNNYGQPPKDNELMEEVTPKRVQRGVYKEFDVEKGDILVTNGTSSFGILGHAAIANGNNNILDIPGFGETTRQLTVKKWCQTYIDSKGWVKVYRLKNKKIANQAANWADYNYYSSNGTSKQDIKPSYSILGSRYSKDPTYCSKIVIQAYYFGTGKEKVLGYLPAFVAPYGMNNCFSDSYKLNLVKTY